MASDHRHRDLLRLVDPSIWRACAGTSVQIPAIHSRVYYFPQGHMEQSANPLSLSPFYPLLTAKPSTLCRIIEVLFLANHDTDEVFAKIRLEPINASSNNGLICEPSAATANQQGVEGEGDLENGVISFAKILTPSDANNGGGFSVPRFCADSIFPPLDYAADPPVQTIKIRDVHGESWDFRHIYRGTPKRHLLTTGWSKFVNSKKLIAGESVVFIKNKMSNELFVGVRRAVKSNGALGIARWAPHYASLGPGRAKMEESGGGGIRGEEREGIFSRDGSGRVSLESVVEAADLAAHGSPFEVVYYPRAGSPDFLVAAEKVEQALSVYWSTGMRVRMAMETEDSSRMTWFQGTVSSVVIPDSGLWWGSPWRMLQVAWDEPDILLNVKKVSPWEVEYIARAPPLHIPFPPTKKFRAAPHISGLTIDGETEFPLQTVEFSNSTIGHFSQSFLRYHSFPAGMQGARHDPFYVSSLPNVISNNTLPEFADDYFGSCKALKMDAVSTELNLGSSLSYSPSPDSPSSVQLFDADIAGRRACSASMKAGATSFQLFGKIILMDQPLRYAEDVGT
ncbi:hypothetical protein Nepgr_002135 [Nepenthes gracilis]|uniref:Auxin response factor n=1 Tax=Nepenthes gracilis TaxID=150966 RepID=A0AAD3P5Q7_NEPGR|nr:hypothetical protein Nepgr_002135 [Nepenthes gracilis]